MKLVDPEVCRGCGKRGKVIRSVKCEGYRRRRYECLHGCQGTDSDFRRWNIFISRISPKIALRRAKQAAAQPAPSVDQAAPATVQAAPRRQRRTATPSSYLSR